jgi:hypothetical protein
MAAGGAGFREACFFEKRIRTVLLADLIENIEPARLPPVTSLAMREARAMEGTTALHVRAVLRLGGREATSSIALSRERVIFAHGRSFDDDGATRLRGASRRSPSDISAAGATSRRGRRLVDAPSTLNG